MTDKVWLDTKYVENCVERVVQIEKHDTIMERLWEEELDMIVECVELVTEYQDIHVEEDCQMSATDIMAMAVDMKATTEDASWYDVSENIKEIISEERDDS